MNESFIVSVHMWHHGLEVAGRPESSSEVLQLAGETNRIEAKPCLSCFERHQPTQLASLASKAVWSASSADVGIRFGLGHVRTVTDLLRWGGGLGSRVGGGSNRESSVPPGAALGPQDGEKVAVSVGKVGWEPGDGVPRVCAGGSCIEHRERLRHRMERAKL